MEIVRSRKFSFLDDSSNSYSKMPKLLVSFLKSFQLCSSGLPIQMPMMPSMNLKNSNSFLLNFGMRDNISWTAKYIVAHMQAADVHIQLDWPCIAEWAYAGIFAVAVQCQNQDQFWISRQTNRGVFYLFIKSKNELVRPKMMFLAILANIWSFSDNSDM